MTPPSRRSLSADSNRPRQRRRRTSSSRASGRSAASGGGDDVDCGAESECSTTSTQQSSIGRPYTPSLLDDASDADVDSLRKDSMDSDVERVHCAPVGSVPWPDSRITDSLASSIQKGIVKAPPLYHPVCVIRLYVILIQ